MTDEHPDEPDFDDPAHLEVRDLLASAKVDTPVPAEVAARLEAGLAELTGGTPAEPHADEVVRPLRREASRSGPRRAPRLLAAAAVVIAAGAGAVGLNQVVGTSGSDDKAGSSVAADSAGGSAEAPAVPAPPTTGELDGSFTETSGGGQPVPVLTTADFTQQAYSLGSDSTNPLQSAARLRADRETSRTPQDTSAKTELSLNARAALACPGPRLDGTRSYPIVLDQQPAVLVVHPANAGSHLVEAWSCSGSKVLAFATVPD